MELSATTCLRGESRFPSWQRAEQLITPYIECAIEARAEVLMRDRRSQLDQLVIRIVLLKLYKECVVHVRRGRRQLLGEAQQEPLGFGELTDVAGLGGEDLFVTQSCGCSAHGRTDVHSK